MTSTAVAPPDAGVDTVPVHELPRRARVLDRREAVDELLRACRRTPRVGLSLLEVGRILSRLDQSGLALASIGQYLPPKSEPARPTQPPAGFLLSVALEQHHLAERRGDTEDAGEYRRLARLLATEAGL